MTLGKTNYILNRKIPVFCTQQYEGPPPNPNSTFPRVKLYSFNEASLKKVKVEEEGYPRKLFTLHTYMPKVGPL
jgi:hypothetical protein